MNKLKNLLPYWPSALSWVLSLAAAAVGWLQVERSAGQENYVLLALAPQYLLLGVLTIFSVHLLVYALCGRRHIATAAGGLIVTVYALVNYYVKMLHGTAILAFDIANAATAADVAGSYDIAPDPTSIKIALCYLPVLAAAVVQWLLYRKSRVSGPAPRGKKAASHPHRLLRPVFVFCVFLRILRPLVRHAPGYRHTGQSGCVLLPGLRVYLVPGFLVPAS